MKKDKRGIEIAELGKIILAIFLLALLVLAVIFLLKGKGGELLASIKNLLRFGR